MKKFILFLALMISSLSVFANQADVGLLFNVTGVPDTMTIKTTVPNHTYASAGIKLNTPGTSIVSGCTLTAKGYCTFSGSNTQAVTITTTGAGKHLNIDLCLDANGPSSCQNYTVSQHFAYVLNISSSVTPYVGLCSVDVNTGAMVSCKDAAANAGVNGVLATAFGLEGIVLDEVNKIAYLSSFGGTPNLYECKFDDKGIFTSCGISVVTSPANYAGSYGMVARNTAQNLLYVVSTDNALITVLACPIDDNGVVSGNCTNTGAPISSAAVQIALNSQNSVAYVGSYSDNYVTVCDVSADGFSFINCVNKTGDNGSVSFIQPAGVALNNTGSMIYVAEYNFSGGNVYACSTTPNGNATYFDSCTPVATGLFNLNGIALDGPNTTAYIANFGSVYVCRINGDGTFAPCTTNSDVPGAVNVTISN